MEETDFLDKLDAPYVIPLKVGGLRFQVEVNDPRLEASVRRYFAPFLTEEQGFEARIIGIQGAAYMNSELLANVPRVAGAPKAAYYDSAGARVILKKRSGVVHYIYGNALFAVGDLARHPQQLLSLVSTAFARHLRAGGFVAIHASGVAFKGNGIVFCGPSSAGKSTVALGLMENGYDYVSNDRIFIRRPGHLVEMAGLPKWPRVNPGTLLTSERLRGLLSEEEIARYESIDPDALWSIEHKHDVLVNDTFGEKRLSLYAELKRFYILSWKLQDGPLSMRSVSSQEKGELVFPMVKSDIYDPPGSVDATPDILSMMLSDIPAFQLTGSVDIPRLVLYVLGDWSR